MAAVLTGGDGAVLSHRSAAALWGIQRYEGQGVDVSLASRSRSSAAIRRHVVALPADEVVRVDGIPVTTVPRTILDLAAVTRPEVVESALREAEYLRLDDRLSLPDLVERYPGRRGVRTVRSVLARRGESPGHTRSPLEVRFLGFLDAYNLPRPQLNAWLRLGERNFEVDCFWPADHQIVELDGWSSHGTMAAFHDDRARDRTFAMAGYGITRLTWDQLDDEPEVIARDLRALLSRAQRSRGKESRLCT
jgi:hypothetical protein